MRVPLMIQIAVVCVLALSAPVSADEETRVVVESDGWKLIGDLRLPDTQEKVPAVLMLNRAAGNRRAYETLAVQLGKRGIASLRLDMRGHGESTNLGRFVPGETDSLAREVIIWDSQADVIAAHKYLMEHPRIEAGRIGMVGASYSGEEMAEAGRLTTYAQAYVALSPGSLSEESIAAMDANPVPWLLVVSRNERHLHEVAAAVQETTKSVEILYVPGEEHATGILDTRPDVAERIAVWLASRLAE